MKKQVDQLEFLWWNKAMKCFSPLSIVRSGATKSADRITVPCSKCAACF